MAIKIIRQLISCALQDKETHRNPEKGKRTQIYLFRTEANFDQFLQLYYYFSVGLAENHDSILLTTVNNHIYKLKTSSTDTEQCKFNIMIPFIHLIFQATQEFTFI